MGKREVFSFKDKALSFLTQKETVDRRNKSKTQNKTKTKNKGNKKAQKTKTTRMISAVYKEYDYLLKSLNLIKKDDLGVPTILCSINRYYFYNTICDTRSGVNICEGINLYTLTARLGPGDLAHYEIARSMIQLPGVSCKETRRGDQAGF